MGWNIKEKSERRKENQFSVYRSGQRSFNSRPAWTYSKAALKKDEGAAYRSDQRSFNSRSALATPREKTEIDLTKKHLRSKPPSSYISQQAITSAALVKPVNPLLDST